MKSSFSYRFRWRLAHLLAGLAGLLLSAPWTWAAPHDEVLRLVPGDVGFCLLIEDFREHWKELADSPFVKHFRASPMAAKVVDAEGIQKLSLADQLLQQYLQ